MAESLDMRDSAFFAYAVKQSMSSAVNACLVAQAKIPGVAYHIWGLIFCGFGADESL